MSLVKVLVCMVVISDAISVGGFTRSRPVPHPVIKRVGVNPGT